MRKILTVSIAAYNVGAYLEQTLESLVLDSDDNRLEVFIIDDGSTDNTSDIGLKFCERYPNIFKLFKKKNGGYGSTVNVSLKNATGKYFKLLDGDDWFQKDTLCQYLDFLEKADSDIVLAPYKIICMPDREVEIRDVHKGLSSSKRSIEEGMIKDSIVHQELVVRTEVLRQYDAMISENCFYTDQEFVFQCILHSRNMAKFKEPVYCYRVGREGQSISIDGLRKHYKDTGRVANNLYRLYDIWLKDVGDEKKRLLQTKLFFSTALVYKANIVRCDVAKAKEELWRFDLNIKRNYPEIYDVTDNVKLIKMLRIVHFKAFSLLRLIYIKLKLRAD